MQVQMKNGGVQHVSAEVAETLIAAGLATKVVEAPAGKSQPSVRFVTIPGPVVGDYEYPPAIRYTTDCCGDRGVCESQKGTAHLSLVVRHCGVVDKVPADVAAEYQAAYTKYTSRSRKKPQVKISASSERDVHAFGMKTQSELKTDAQVELLRKR